MVKSYSFEVIELVELRAAATGSKNFPKALQVEEARWPDGC